MFQKSALLRGRSASVVGYWASLRRSAKSWFRPSNRSIQPVIVILVLSQALFSVAGRADDKEISVLTGSRAAAAIVITAQPGCAQPPIAMPQVVIRWVIDDSRLDNPSGAGALMASFEFRIDVTMFRDGLKEGRFQSHTIDVADVRGDTTSDHLQGPGQSVVVPNLRAAVNYSARVLVLTPEGWVASEEVKFITPICPVDGLK